MIKAVILDDEKHAIETLKWKLENYCPDVKVISTFNDPEDGVEYLNSHKVDLLFLDIEMPVLTGFGVLQEMKSFDFDVIFTTAYDKYGIRAIKYSALDYLLKPVQIDELQEAITKYQKKHFRNVLPQQLEVLFQSLQKDNAKNQKIALATKESIELVRPSDIVYCESDNNYTYVFLNNGKKKLISKTLKEFEELLGPFNFYRSHQSYLVNIDHISEFMRHDGGYLIMNNGQKVGVSRNKKEGLLSLF